MHSTAWPCPNDCNLYARSLFRSLLPSRPPGLDLQVWHLHTCFRCPTIASAPSILLRLPYVRPPLPVMPAPSSARLASPPKLTVVRPSPLLTQLRPPSFRFINIGSRTTSLTRAQSCGGMIEDMISPTE
ncbi:hypothetical protein B296_00051333 [Ensete ventricosum]|uniref:Uncharacterized protein n=1 Tax=Ensete ventricosum TaxID=4639 RepID=A0A426XWZ4_ENSVE|nr:hypothetical protein B296_00051333 [Ensete ventricosum]